MKKKMSKSKSTKTPMVKGKVVKSSASNRKPKLSTKKGKTAY